MIFYLLIGVALAIAAHIAFRWTEKQNDEQKARYKAWATRGGITGIIFLLIRVGVLRLGTIFNALTLLLPFLLSSKPREQRAAPPSFGMTREEAAKVLGVRANAPREEIEKAYRRLMQRAHPDAGGSDFLAAQINHAREVLLKK